MFQVKFGFAAPLIAVALVGSASGQKSTKKNAAPTKAKAVKATKTAVANVVEPGSKAPPLQVKNWFKGKPLKEVPKGVAVVEFWATWCGPCIQAIPHVTELAKKNPEVTFIGVSVWEDNNGGIQKFVDDMGDKMDYNVGWSGNQTGMSQTWLKPAGQNGIPCSFIVKDGVIQWIGHPMNLDSALAEVKENRFDLPKFRASFRKQAEQAKLEMAAYEEMESLDKLWTSGKRKEAKARMAQFEKKNPKQAENLKLTKFLWLSQENPAAWEKQANELSQKKGEGITMLCQFAIRSLDGAFKNHSRAVQSMDLAIAGSKPEEQMPLFYAFHVYPLAGEKAKGIAAGEKLMTILPQTAEFAETRADLEKRLSDLKSQK